MVVSEEDDLAVISELRQDVLEAYDFASDVLACILDGLSANIFLVWLPSQI